MTELDVVIEVPRGGFVKYAPDGRVEFVSPLPCPFNYGSVPDQLGDDGDPLDAIVLGPRLHRGARGRWPVHGCVRFEDAGVPDDKWVVGERQPGRVRRAALVTFFTAYATGKRLANLLRGRPGPTRCLGWQACVP